MGLTSHGVPTEVVLSLAKHAGASVFVEAGTFMGGTTRWASAHFKSVFTIELSDGLYQGFSEELRKLGNVEPLQGDSRTVLPGILPKLEGNVAVHWLDDHWSGQGTAGEHDECPILGELLLLEGRHDDIILIDDARLFLAAPPSPHKPDHWPTISETVDALRKGGNDRFIQIFDDVIFAVPNREGIRNDLIAHAQRSHRGQLGFWQKVGVRTSKWRSRVGI